MKCDFDDCHEVATFHVTDLESSKTTHWCHQHAHHKLVRDAHPSFPDSSRQIDYNTYCLQCGHDKASYFGVVNEGAFSCPGCSRNLLNVTGTHCTPLTDSIFNPTIIRECRTVPIAYKDGIFIVASDFAESDKIEKMRFLTNTDCLLVYAEPEFIDSLISQI